MALTATIYQFDLDLADHDRHVYESLNLRVARHPSETEDYLIARVLAYALEFTEGIEFSKGGLSSPDEPAIVVRDLTGRCRAWIEIGAPEAERLHRASKQAARVAVYVHREPRKWIERMAEARIHRADEIEAWALDRPLVAALAAGLDRRVTWAVSVSERELTVSVGQQMLTGPMTRLPLGGRS